jgi:chromosome segregation ATPase
MSPKKKTEQDEQIESTEKSSELTAEDILVESGLLSESELPDSKTRIEDLPPDIQKHIKGLRQEAASRRIAAKELQAQIEDLKGQIQSFTDAEMTANQQFKELADQRQEQIESLQAKLQHEALQRERVTIGARYELAFDWIERLRGDTAQELEEDAQRLVGLLNSLSTTESEVSEEEQPEEGEDTPVKKTAKTTKKAVPSGADAKTTTNEERRQRYFGDQGYSPVFDEQFSGGVSISTKGTPRDE